MLGAVLGSAQARAGHAWVVDSPLSVEKKLEVSKSVTSSSSNGSDSAQERNEPHIRTFVVGEMRFTAYTNPNAIFTGTVAPVISRIGDPFSALGVEALFR